MKIQGVQKKRVSPPIATHPSPTYRSKEFLKVLNKFTVTHIGWPLSWRPIAGLCGRGERWQSTTNSWGNELNFLNTRPVLHFSDFGHHKLIISSLNGQQVQKTW